MSNAKQKDSFFRSRGLVGVVNYQMPFIYANQLGFNPKKTYFLVQDYGFDRVKQVFDFYVSIWETAGPSFFSFTKDGRYDPESAKERFKTYILSALKYNQALITKFAGPRYFAEGWAKKPEREAVAQ